MVRPAAGAVILLPFPFSDLSRSKFRPAVVLADAGRGDWILCQVTSNPYADSRAVALGRNDFQEGSLPIVSHARPGKLFTANERLMAVEVGLLKAESLRSIIDGVIDILTPK